MRWAAGILLAAALASPALADPPPEPVGPDVTALARQARADPKAARDGLDTLARAGRADAAEALGEALQFGVLGPPDYPAACGYYALASGRRGDATHNHALCYELGVIGGQPDLARAAQLYEAAAGLGFAKANCALGNFYMSGRGVAKDVARGLALCRQAAEAGVADAQTDIGNVYLAGQIVPRDVVAARGWYEKAAAQGQANAAIVLGQIYWNGDGVKRDIDRAAALWRVAYKGGREDAALHLGDVAFLKARRGEGKWNPKGLAEARDRYAEALDARNPVIAQQARERRDLSEQLIGAMQRKTDR